MGTDLEADDGIPIGSTLTVGTWFKWKPEMITRMTSLSLVNKMLSTGVYPVFEFESMETLVEQPDGSFRRVPRDAYLGGQASRYT
jgi:hypothetical protein